MFVDGGQAISRARPTSSAPSSLIENALSVHTREQRRLDTLRAAVAANRRALDLATKRYTGGLENFLSVLDAQRAVYGAEDGLAQSATNAMVSLIAVYKALGGGWTLGPEVSSR